MLSMVLKSRNIECDIAENGQEAVDLVAANGDLYDFIFMDFTMPIMNGADATSAIRKNGHNRLIFGLTGNALDTDKCIIIIIIIIIVVIVIIVIIIVIVIIIAIIVIIIIIIVVVVIIIIIINIIIIIVIIFIITTN
jgi:PleD family two-component response regulator